MPRRLLIRNLEASRYFETFLVSAVASILLVRFYLYLAGFPKVGGNGLHIAHMLWGGLLMLVALIVLLSFVDTGGRLLGSLLAGVGFGLFIDEVGKFVTSDNNYFFRPAVALMYIVFVLIYLAVVLMENRRTVSRRAYLINSLEAFKESVIRDLDRYQLNRAHTLLDDYREANTLTRSLRRLFTEVRHIGEPSSSELRGLRQKIRKLFLRIVYKKQFDYAVLGIYVGASILVVFSAIVVTASLGDFVGPKHLTLNSTTRSFERIGDFFFSTLASVLVVAGAIVGLRSRLAGYRLFKAGVLVSIFLAQVFQFDLIQFGALIWLSYDILALVVINALIKRERLREQRRTELEGQGEEVAEPAPVAASQSP